MRGQSSLIMSGATAATLAAGQGAAAIVPVIVGVLLLAVAYGRWQLAPHRNVARIRPA